MTGSGERWPEPTLSEVEDRGGSGCFGEFYVGGIMVHEIGHGLGLLALCGPSCERPEAKRANIDDLCGFSGASGVPLLLRFS